MKILYVDWQMFGKEDIIKALRHMGHEVDQTDLPLQPEMQGEILKDALKACLTAGKYNAVFTSNFYPIVSMVCEQLSVKYISWIYDSPLIGLYNPAIMNTCNYVFTFDRDECNNLRSKGVQNIYYMPLGVAVDRISNLSINSKDREIFSAEVGMVASLYNEKHNLYDRMEPRLSEYTRGYLEAVMQAQKNLFGGFILEEVLYNERIMQDMLRAMPYELDKGSLANVEYVYANYFLSRKVATMQRTEFIDAISKKHIMKVYSPGDLSMIPTAIHMGTVDYNTDMNKVFRLSKINLNITLPSIHTGIPLRAMDIMGAGGFLLTNYQADFMESFVPNEDFVYFTSMDEALALIDYYLEHEEERQRIAENGRRKVAEQHSYLVHLKEILSIVEG